MDAEQYSLSPKEKNPLANELTMLLTLVYSHSLLIRSTSIKSRLQSAFVFLPFKFVCKIRGWLKSFHLQEKKILWSWWELGRSTSTSIHMARTLKIRKFLVWRPGIFPCVPVKVLPTFAILSVLGYQHFPGNPRIIISAVKKRVSTCGHYGNPGVYLSA